MLLALSQTGKLVGTGAILGAAVLVVLAGDVFVRRRRDDRYSQFHLRRVIRYVVAICAGIALLVLWRAFQGHTSVVVGLAVAGFAFALQEAIGAVAGWFNILTGHIYRVGDRIEIAGVHGDVIDVTLLRTKLLEIGSTTPEEEPSSWVRGRQYTGRIVAFSNKTTFTEPTFNYSSLLDFIWDEVTIPIPYRADWHEAERILQEEVERISASAAAQEAIAQMERRYPVPRTEVEPRVFVRMTDNWMELAARFVVPVRHSRTLKSDLARRVRERYDAAGIEVASATMDVTVRPGETG